MNKYPEVKFLERTDLLNSYIKVMRDDIIVDGNKITRDVVKRGVAVAVLPILDNGNFLLVKQYRHPAEDYLWEIPSGMVEKSELVVAAVVRELEEETGYIAQSLEQIYAGFSSPGVFDELIIIHVARLLKLGNKKPDPDEFLEVREFSPQEISQMITNDEINDMKTMLAFSLYLLAEANSIFNKHD